MDHFAPRNYNSFLRISLLVGAGFYLIGAVTNYFAAVLVWDPLPIRVGLSALMALGSLLSHFKLLNEKQTELYAFGTGIASVLWVGLMLYANHLQILYVMAAYLTVGIFPFMFNRTRLIRLLLGICLVVMVPSILLTPKPELPAAGVAGLMVLVVLIMNFMAIKLLDSRITLSTNQQKLSNQLKENSAITAQLQLAEERLGHAISGNQDGIWDWDILQDALYLSPSWCGMFGYTEANAPKNYQELYVLIHPDDEEALQDSFRVFLENAKTYFRCQFRLRCADGSYKHILARAKSVSFDANGDPTRIVGTHADISAQIAAEIQSRQSEIRNQALIDALPDMIFQLNPEGYFIGFKTGNESELLLEPAQIIGKHVRDIPFPKAIHDLMLFTIEKAWIQGTVEIFEYSIPIQGGEQFYEARVVKCGELEIICIVRNVTDRQLKHASLVEAKERAEAAAVARAQFLSTMSHEIRTPLNAVIGISHLLMQDNPTAEQLDLLNTLRFSSENLLVIINDVLDYSKIESGKIDFEKTPISLSGISTFVIRSLQQKADEKHLAISIDIDPEIPETVMGDSTRLGQILTNLVNNAIKFTEEGSVLLRLEKLASTGEMTHVKFSVKDTGIGIPENKLNIIFDSFTQASADHTRKYGGTGLGLAICKQLLILQGSDLYVSSREDIGSEFYFTLTFQTALQTASKQDMGSEFQFNDFLSLRGFHILLVEDNAVNQKIAMKFLQKWDILVESAENGRVALDKLSVAPYDLILMDLQMPVMDGYTAARNIRSNASWDHIPILALTANAQQDVREEVLALGMQDYITKPFNPTDLYRKIARNLPVNQKH